jgi:PAS domain S-box-containing protein/putative nucleotidyltransferase with HDIG domain
VLNSDKWVNKKGVMGVGKHMKGQNRIELHSDEVKKLRRRIVELELSESERIRAEQLLHYQAHMLENVSDAIISTDIELHIRTWNKAATTLYGWQVHEVIDEVVDKVTHVQSPSQWREEVVKTIHTRGSWQGEVVQQKRDGTPLHIFSSVTVIKDNADVPIGFILINHDCTQNTHALKVFRDDQARYESLTKHLNVGVYRNTSGPRGKFIEVNPAFIEMFGYAKKEEIFEMNVADLYQNPDDRKKFNKKMLQDGFVRNEELPLKKKDGTQFIGSVSAVAVKNEEDIIEYYDGVIEDITRRKQIEEELHQSLDKLHRVLDETVNALASAVAKKNPYTEGHQHRVTQLACAIAQELHLSQEQIHGLRLAGLLHDIGKIAVPVEILSKPSRLSQSEWELITTHPTVGYDILKPIEFPWRIADIVHQHHERLDGSGYPQGLKNGNILIEARILAVADVIEAMSSHRPYRPAHSLETTLEGINKYKDILYDSQIVDICLKLFHKMAFKFES